LIFSFRYRYVDLCIVVSLPLSITRRPQSLVRLRCNKQEQHVRPFKLAASSPPTLRAPGGKARCGRPTAHVRVMIVDCPGLRRADPRGPHRHLEPSPSPLCTLATRGRPRQRAALGDAASGARPPHCAHHSAPAFAMRHAHHSAPAFAMRHAHHSAPAFAIRHGATVYFVIVNSSATLPLLARV
jgi:hypothetical protein